MESTNGQDKSNGSDVDSGSGFLSFFAQETTRTYTQLPCRRDEMCYNMTHSKRGRCIILNYREFDLDLNRREGTDRDAQSLEDTFTKLKFDVEVHHNLSYSETKQILNKESSRNFDNYDCLVMCILTHGSHGILYCKDKEFNTADLFGYFTADRCKGLTGKPKLFFIQACQGEQFDNGTIVHDSRSSSDPGLVRIPNYADILVFYSTYPGFFSWRNIKEGSWFIQSLCQVLEKHSSEYDLSTMLTLTTQKVAFDYQSNVPGRPDMDKKKQIPCVMSTLTRLLYLN